MPAGGNKPWLHQITLFPRSKHDCGQHASALSEKALNQEQKILIHIIRKIVASVKLAEKWSNAVGQCETEQAHF